MRHIKRVLLSLLLSALFIAYQASIIVFAHLHCANGVLITDSHLSKCTHSHTKTTTVVVDHLMAFHTLEAGFQAEQAPVCRAIYTVQIDPKVAVVALPPLREISLRAPPQLAA